MGYGGHLHISWHFDVRVNQESGPTFPRHEGQDQAMRFAVLDPKRFFGADLLFNGRRADSELLIIPDKFA
jgi:hypothetical protein